MVRIFSYLNEHISSYKTYYEEFFNSYRKRVHEYYEEEFKSNPKDFPFMNGVKVTIIFREGDILVYFEESISGQDEYVPVISLFKTIEEEESYRDLPEHLKEKKLKEIIKLAGVKDYIDHKKHWYAMEDDPKPKWDDDVPIIRGKGTADSHYRSSEFIGIKDTFNAEYIINKVNSIDFKYEFEEAIIAYNSGLFLASSVTAAVALETALKIAFIHNFSEDELPKQYYILSLAEKLKVAGKIPERLYHRIRSVNELRRGAAHSKSGRVDKWDAEQVIGSVKIIVEALF